MVTVKCKAQELSGGVARRLGRRWAWVLLLTLTGISWQAHSASSDDSLRGPDIVIIAEEERTIFEFRQGGELRMVRIVPRVGKPYYLVPRDQTKGFGNLERADMLLPSWVIVEF